MLTPEQKDRYARQIMLPEIGETGQEILGRSRVLIAGLGGLGSLVSLYLTAAGVGMLRLADRDTVSLPDLNRQILYIHADIGRIKADVASERLLSLNGSCRIDPVCADICAAAEHLLEGCDMVIDATDNLPARRAINRAAVKLGVPMVHGGIDGFSGTLTVILPGKSACFECLFPDRGADPAPRRIGAIGPVVGMVASLQCTEALKLLLAVGRPMADRMLIIRADRGEWKSIRTRRNPNCALCASM
jgi:molybdopterin/thiamine biosynthesis adenylyltransferase